MQTFPPLLIQFFSTLAFSFLVGLEYHSYTRVSEHGPGFGTTRTFTVIGVLGFVLYSLDPQRLLFGIGMVALLVLLGIHYWRRSAESNYSLLHPVLVLLVYAIGPVSIELPMWFLVLYVVSLVLLLGEKPGIRRVASAFSGREISILAKFLIMAGVVLPLLPDRQITSFIGVTYYQVWLAVIVVSGISYFGYLSQKYLFKGHGLLLTGILGGLYSSTATTVVLSRRAQNIADRNAVSATLIVATVMMYLRLLVLVATLGHVKAAVSLLQPFLLMIAGSLVAALVLYRSHRKVPVIDREAVVQHPLELATALLFAALFLFFATLTGYVTSHFGSSGLHWLAFAVGFTDIDPFILSLLAGKYQVAEAQIIAAVLISSGSNNLLKAAYALALDRSRTLVPAVVWLVVLFAASLGYVYLML